MQTTKEREREACTHNTISYSSPWLYRRPGELRHCPRCGNRYHPRVPSRLYPRGQRPNVPWCHAVQWRAYEQARSLPLCRWHSQGCCQGHQCGVAQTGCCRDSFRLDSSDLLRRSNYCPPQDSHEHEGHAAARDLTRWLGTWFRWICSCDRLDGRK